MAHSLEFNKDGKAQVMLRKDAWHHLGTVVGDNFGWLDAIASDLAITKSVSKVALRDVVMDGFDCADDQYAAVRQDGKVLYGGHGEAWAPFQTEAAYEFVQFLRDEQGIQADLESLGTIRHGTQWFMTFKSGQFDIGGFDVTDYLTASGSFNGTWKFQVQSHQTVAVCANTITAIRWAGRSHYAFKNTTNIADRVEEAKRVVEMQRDRQYGFKAFGERLLNAEVSNLRFKYLVDDLFPLDDEMPKRAFNRNADARKTVGALFRSASNDGPEVAAGVEGTGWAFMQAVNTYENWGTAVRASKGQSKETARALRQMDTALNGSQPLTDQAVALLIG